MFADVQEEGPDELPDTRPAVPSATASPEPAPNAFRDHSIVLVTESLGPQPFHGRIAILVNQHSAGVKPDFEVQLSREMLAGGTDSPLERAVEELSSIQDTASSARNPG